MWNTNLIYSLNILFWGIKVEDFENFNCSREVRVLPLRAWYHTQSNFSLVHTTVDFTVVLILNIPSSLSSLSTLEINRLFSFLPIHILFCYQYLIY